MATIQIPDSLLPDGYEFAEPAFVHSRTGIFFGEDPSKYVTVSVPVRPKPRLKKIVLTVAGEPRQIRTGEWRLLTDGSADLWTPEYTTPGKFIPSSARRSGSDA